MCGIVGAVAERNITPILLEGLKRLEYRGYDSAGVAVFTNAGKLERMRRPGKVSELEQAWPPNRWSGAWASPTPAGPPTVRRASVTPTRIFSGDLAVVHNGIIENHEALREQLKAWVMCSPRTPTPKSSPTCSIHKLKEQSDLTAAPITKATVNELHRRLRSGGDQCRANRIAWLPRSGSRW